MGTISDKLVYLDGTREQIKENLNKFGADLTENDTFRSYSNVLNDIYDKLPKVSGNGSNFTLESVQNGKLDLFEMEGNTEQTTYSGKNLLAYTSYGEAKQGITTTYDSEDGALILNGTANNTFSNLTNESSIDIATGTYTFSIKEAKNYNIRLAITCTDNTTINATINKGSTSTTFNVNKATLNQRIFIYENDTLSGTTFTNEKIYAQLESSSTPTSFEPYVGGVPSPNPDYPQNINVVSGNQVVNVSGKNLFDGLVEEGQYNTSTGAKQVGTNLRSANYISVNPNSTIKFSVDGVSKAVNILEYKDDYTFIQYTNVSANNTITLTNETKFITLYRGAGDGSEKWQIEYGSTATEYEPYYAPQNYTIGLGSMELCKIDTYKDSIKKSTGKNLFDIDTSINDYFATINNGEKINTGANISDYVSAEFTTNEIKILSYNNNGYRWLSKIINLKKNTDYTISASKLHSVKVVGFNSLEDGTDGTRLAFINNQSLTPPKTFNSGEYNYYVVTMYPQEAGNVYTNIQLEEGSTATDYEPYGTDWYIKKEIGKVVLDGSENDWGISKTGNYFYINKSDMRKSSSGWEIAKAYSNNYYPYAFDNIYNGTPDYGLGIGYNSALFAIRNKNITSVNDFKTWLSTHNTEVYYILETPTYEKITNETLISQLESIEAFTGLNNFSVSNENNVLPTLYVSRLKELGKLE